MEGVQRAFLPAGAALLAAALTLTTGCATRNGDVAAFCRELPRTSAISLLEPNQLAQSSSPAQVSARLHKVSTELRKLERAAPRTIRSDVATVANFTQRFAFELDRILRDNPTGPTSATTLPPMARLDESGHSATAGHSVQVIGPDGQYGVDPDGWWNNPIFMAYNRVGHRYPGALKASASFVDYAKDHCGERVLPQGYVDYSDQGTGTGNPYGEFNPDGTPIGPQVSAPAMTPTVTPPEANLSPGPGGRPNAPTTTTTTVVLGAPTASTAAGAPTR